MTLPFVIVRPRPAAFTIGSGKTFDRRTVDKVGHKVGRIIGSIPRSGVRRRRLTKYAMFHEDHRLNIR
jgi:hypothetical protein